MRRDLSGVARERSCNSSPAMGLHSPPSPRLLRRGPIETRFAHCRTDPSFNHGALPVSILSRTGMSWEHLAVLIRRYPDML